MTQNEKLASVSSNHIVRQLPVPLTSHIGPVIVRGVVQAVELQLFTLCLQCEPIEREKKKNGNTPPLKAGAVGHRIVVAMCAVCGGDRHAGIHITLTVFILESVRFNHVHIN